MITAFVTGGSGFVGRNLIRALRARGDEVRALARSETAATAVTALGAIAVRVELDDVAGLQAGLRGCDVVFHAAAQVTEWGSRELFQRVNVEGTRKLIQAACRAGVPKLVHVSTEAVLADGSPLSRVDETRPLPARPLPRYPASKAESEALVLAANSPDFQTVVVRPRLIWGADDTSLLPQLLEAVNSGRFMWINGGRHLTSTCHVGNVVEGLLLAAAKGRGGEIYFLTDGEPLQFRGFMTRMLATQGVRLGDKSLPRGLVYALAWISELLWELLPLSGKPPVTRMTVTLFGQEVTVSDAKARRELGYRALISVEQGLADLARRRA